MSFVSGLFGDDSDAYENYQRSMQNIAQQVQGLSAPYQYYADIGKQGTQNYYDQAQWLMQNPNALQDMVAQGYQQSPYQAELLRRTTELMNNNAANTGMLGAGRQQQALQENLMNMSGQFMNDYIDRGMNTYGNGFNAMGQFPYYGMNALGAMTNIGLDAANYMGDAAGAQLQADRSSNGWMGNALGSLVGMSSSFLGGGLGQGKNGGFGWGAGFSGLNRRPNSSTMYARY